MRPLKIIVCMETSGAIRRRFRALGHDAYSCDFLPAVDSSPFHLRGDVLDYTAEKWDAAILHPTCTFSTYSAEWLYSDGPFKVCLKPGTLYGAARREARESAVLDMFLYDAATLHIPVRVWENPEGEIWKRWKPATQRIQPYQFGDDASKKTCLRIEGLPIDKLPIDPAARRAGRWVEYPPGSGRYVERWANQSDSGQNNTPERVGRWAERSATYPGIADAIVWAIIRGFSPATYTGN